MLSSFQCASGILFSTKFLPQLVFSLEKRMSDRSMSEVCAPHQNPSHPFWCGAQTSDIDLSDMRFSKLNTSWGKNFVENKMPEAHWKLESIERGARIVVITPEYNPTATRADYWMPVRPQSDGALFCGAMKIIIDENMHDVDFLKGYTDSPILIRTDTLQYLDPRDVIKDFKFPDYAKRYSGMVQSLKPETIERLGGCMVWDLTKQQPAYLDRELVGWHYQQSGIDAALTGTYRVKLLNGREVDVMPIWQAYLVHFQDYDLDTVHQINRSEEHTSELQSRLHLVCRLLLEKKKKKKTSYEDNKQKTPTPQHNTKNTDTI